MDPTATLTELLDALRTHDRDTAFGRLESLLDWLSKGGAFPEIPAAPPSPRYQGWANHATWAVSLWLNNDHGTYLFCRQLAREAVEDAADCEPVRDGMWTAAQAQRFILGDRVKDYLAESNPLSSQPSAFADLLSAALDDVNYDELADALLDDFGS